MNRYSADEYALHKKVIADLVREAHPGTAVSATGVFKASCDSERTWMISWQDEASGCWHFVERASFVAARRYWELEALLDAVADPLRSLGDMTLADRPADDEVRRAEED